MKVIKVGIMLTIALQVISENLYASSDSALIYTDSSPTKFEENKVGQKCALCIYKYSSSADIINYTYGTIQQGGSYIWQQVKRHPILTGVIATTQNNIS